jgi:hypothetical protein
MTVEQVADLERLFPGSGWVFGVVWVPVNSGPDARQLTARRGGVTLAAADVPGLAEQVRRAEAG